MFSKHENKRLKGMKQRLLHQRVYERDGACCAICGRYVEPGTKCHHEPPKSKGGQDIEENLLLLCERCHEQRHFGSVKIYRQKCEEYLKVLYGE